MNSTMQPWKCLSASIQIGVLTEGWNLSDPPADGAEDARTFRCTVVFNVPFDSPPLVHLGLSGFDVDWRDSSRVSARAVDITASTFVAEVTTWRETRVYCVELNWLAIGP